MYRRVNVGLNSRSRSGRLCSDCSPARRCGIDASFRSHAVAACVPLSRQVLWHRVVRPKGDEIGYPWLIPVRQVPFADRCPRRGIKELKCHARASRCRRHTPCAVAYVIIPCSTEHSGWRACDLHRSRNRGLADGTRRVPSAHVSELTCRERYSGAVLVEMSSLVVGTLRVPSAHVSIPWSRHTPCADRP